MILKVCRGPAACTNAIFDPTELVDGIHAVCKNPDASGSGHAPDQSDLKPHHKLKISISCCPNGCSMPQIADFGVILAGPVMVTDAPCSACGACLQACQESAIILDPTAGPRLYEDKCLHCGACAGVCPTGTISRKPPGFRVMIGGKLGRHPRLATELPGVHPSREVLRILEQCLALRKGCQSQGKRFADLFAAYGEQELLQLLSRKSMTPIPPESV